MRQKGIHLALAIILTTTLTLTAQDQSKPAHAPEVDEESLKKANNPMADVKAVNIHNYIVSSIYGTDMQQNQLLLRYAQPIGKFLIRATMPFVTVSQPQESPTFGPGDLNVFAIYSFYNKGGNQLGIGPALSAPTATSDFTGAGKWQIGLSALAFMA